LCLSQRHNVGRMLASRHTQTNEPGRAALLAVGLAAATDLIGEPIGLLDAGCSAGLNLLVDRYRFGYGPMGSLGPADSPVAITCELRGTAPVPARFPAIAARRASTAHRSISPRPMTFGGCSRVSGPTPGAWTERPRPWSWPAGTRRS